MTELSTVSVTSKLWISRVIRNNSLNSPVFPTVVLPASQLLMVCVSGNDIVALPASLFESVPRLSQLRLDNNKLSVLSSRLFHPLTRLVLMDLSTNSLQAGCDSCLSRKSFKGLGSLIVLNLSRNQISSVQPEMFSDLTNLQSLDMSANTINRLTTGKNSIYKRKGFCRNLTTIR